jgi:hypothetical protein
MFNKALNVQVSDTTKDHSSNQMATQLSTYLKNYYEELSRYFFLNDDSLTINSERSIMVLVL